MATFPSKVNYATGDILTATNMNDVGGAINLLSGAQNSAGKNGIINGGMDIWQRGTTNVTTASAFTADRWQKNSATSYGISRVAVGDTTNLPQIQYAARIQRTAGSAVTTACALVYSMETNDSIRFAGQTVTISFYARKGADYSGGNFAVIIYTGTGTDQNLVSGYTGGAAQVTAGGALTTSMARYSATVTLPATATEVGIYCAFTPTGTAGTNDYVDMTGVQLEYGSTVSPFMRNGATIQGELAACQRYYFRFDLQAINSFGFGFASSTTNGSFIIPFPVTLRTAATALEQSGTTTDYTVTNAAGNQAATAVPTFGSSSKYNSNVNCTAAVLVAGEGVRLRGATTNAYLAWSAEL
jgi:hypothetical protein